MNATTVRWIRHLQNALTNPWFRKQGATLANFILFYQKIFVPKNLSLKFMHNIFIQMIRELFGYFLHFISLVELQFEKVLPQFGVS